MTYVYVVMIERLEELVGENIASIQESIKKIEILIDKCIYLIIYVNTYHQKLCYIIIITRVISSNLY